jgi:Uma2 family endonuclease
MSDTESLGAWEIGEHAMTSAEVGRENRVVLRDVSWKTFRALAREGRGGRLTFDRGQLEIMSPSFAHENTKKLIARLVEIFAEETGIDMTAAGSTTFGREDLSRGIESDECYYIANAALVQGKDEIELPFDPPPDLAIEVDITRSSMDKLSICAALGIPEVWRYRGGAIEIHVLQDSGEYKPSKISRVLPGFPMDEVNRLLEGRGASSDTQLARSFQSRMREDRETP